MYETFLLFASTAQHNGPSRLDFVHYYQVVLRQLLHLHVVLKTSSHRVNKSIQTQNPCLLVLRSDKTNASNKYLVRVLKQVLGVENKVN
jgi:hypothetical protein